MTEMKESGAQNNHAKCHTCDDKIMKFIKKATKRIDNLEKSKQAEEEILNNSTQVIQEAPEKAEKKKEKTEDAKTLGKEESENETEVSSDDSNSEYEKEELQAECEELKKN